MTQKQMEELFDVKHATISEHITKILTSGELDETSVGFSDKSSGGRKPNIYNLDMILSVGYRVNSKRGIAFRTISGNPRQFNYRDESAGLCISVHCYENKNRSQDLNLDNKCFQQL